MSFALLLFSNIARIDTSTTSPGFVLDLTPDPHKPDTPMKAIGWRRSIRGVGGYWQGEFTLSGSENDLSHFFYSNLGNHIEERAGGVKTWEGMIYEMELTVDGSTRRRSLDSMFNHVRVRHITTANEITITDAATNDDSIFVYGRKEDIWPLDGQDLAPAEQLRDSRLREFAYPIAKEVGTTLGVVGGASLFVRVAGYSYTANWRYESAQADTDDDLNQWLSDMLTNDCPFLQEGYIRPNTLQVRKKTRIEMRVWDIVTKMLELGYDDGTNKIPTRAWVDNDRYFHYDVIETTPHYFKRGGGLYDAPGSHLDIDPWRVRPSVVRNMTYPIQTFEANAWLEDARDYYMSEVEVWDNGDGTAKLIPKGEDYDEAEIISAQESYKRQMERLKESNV